MLDELVSGLSESSYLAEYCGRSFDALTNELKDLSELITLLSNTATDAANLLSCENIVPIYTSSGK